MSTLWPASGGNCHRHNGGGNAKRHVATLIKQDLIQGKVGAESWLPFSLRRGGPHGVTVRESLLWTVRAGHWSPGLQKPVPTAGSGDGKAADCCSRTWLRLAPSTTWPASAGRSQRQCPGLKREVTHCEPEETSASCLGSDLLWADKMAPQWAERLSPSKSIRINF